VSDHVFAVRLDASSDDRWRGTVEELATGRCDRFESLDALMALVADRLDLEGVTGTERGDSGP
jgi:hypothetical protein